ncbi:hypothetical protein [Gemmatimonas sp.]|uniref:hypothetical protein n=1 Tax=Gemmatimonas sp. TaxID=1962908 RepID=UPI003565AB58
MSERGEGNGIIVVELDSEHTTEDSNLIGSYAAQHGIPFDVCIFVVIRGIAA